MSKFRQNWLRLVERTSSAIPSVPRLARRSATPILWGIGATTLLVYYTMRTPLLAEKSTLPFLNSAGEAEGRFLRSVTVEELKQHITRESCWVVVGDEVWDITAFLDDHPGGADVILAQAGKDATAIFHPFHPPRTLQENAGFVRLVGRVDSATILELHDGQSASEAELAAERRAQLGPVHSMISLKDFTEAAKWVLGDQSQTFAYYSAAADDEQATKRNSSAFDHLHLLPRVLIPISVVDTSTTFLGKPTALPIFVAPTAFARRGHPDGEMNMTRASRGNVQCVSSNASCGLEELFAARDEPEPEDKQKTTIWFQLYVNKDRKKSERVIKKAVNGGCEAIGLTVDAPFGGKWEKAIKAKGEYVKPSLEKKDTAGSGGASFSYLDADLTWKDIAWIKSIAPTTPILLKGISTPADVDLAFEHGCKGVILSNHGGRQLDSAPAPLSTLIQVRRKSNYSARKAKGFEIYIDGGITRGSDVIKAIACGAQGVAIGRPFVYAQTCYGHLGVKRVFDIMQEEISLTMRLLGVTSIKQLGPQHVELLDGLLGRPIVED